MANKISILVPCYNEQETLPLFYEEISKVMNDGLLHRHTCQFPAGTHGVP